MTGGAAIIETLAAHGVELVFGIPGTHNLSIYRHLARGPIRHITPRHEQGAGFAADGYARSSGRPGVCIVTTGPAVTNIATAAAQAYSDSIPLVIISPALPTRLAGKASGFLHEAKDQHGAMDSLLAWSHHATSAADAVAAIHRAFRSFGTGRPRPVHIEVPIDLLEGEADVDIPAPAAAEPPAPEAAAVAAVVRVLRGAGRPAIVAGGGARGAARMVQALAERIGAPVVTTFNGKGVLPEDHPLALGAGIHLAAARSFLDSCDAVVAIGTELAEADMWSGGLDLHGDLIRIDVDPGQLHKNYPAAVPVLGDAGRALSAILAELGPTDAMALAAGTERAAAARVRIAREAEAEGEPWLPLMRALAGALAPDAIICGDSAMVCYYGAACHLPAYAPSTFLYPTGYGTLGYGVPAAIGAKLAHPDRQVVALMGDGGIMFTVAELATAVDQRLAIPIIISNNGGYGEIAREMDAMGFRLAVELHAPDFAALGRAFGAHGVRLSSPDELPAALEAAFAADRPTVIEVSEG